MCTAGQRVSLTITGPGPSFLSRSLAFCLPDFSRREYVCVEDTSRVFDRESAFRRGDDSFCHEHVESDAAAPPLLRVLSVKNVVRRTNLEG